MEDKIRLNAFTMNCTGHVAPGLWRHPRDQSGRYVSLSHWLDLARLLERGKSDGIFLADVLGPYDVYEQRADAALRQGLQTPVNDPLIVAPTSEEAEAKLGEYRSFVDHEGALALMSGWTGVDLSLYRPDQVLRRGGTDANQSALDSFTVAEPDRHWTIREIAEYVGLGGRGPVIAGSPQKVADALQAWRRATGVDGFNLASAVMPETFADVVDLLVPELQRRGIYKTEYQPGTLREKLFQNGPPLPGTHPGGRKR